MRESDNRFVRLTVGSILLLALHREAVGHTPAEYTCRPSRWPSPLEILEIARDDLRDPVHLEGVDWLFEMALEAGMLGVDSQEGSGVTPPLRELVLADYLQRRGEPVQALAALWEYAARQGLSERPEGDADGYHVAVERRIVEAMGGSLPEAVPLHRAFQDPSTAPAALPIAWVELGGLEVQAEEASASLWRALMGWERHCWHQSEESLPVACIDAFDALHFANEASLAAGLQPVYRVGPEGVSLDPNADGYRLPTAEEWTRIAAAAGVWPLGDREPCSVGNVFDRSARRAWLTPDVRPHRCKDGVAGLLPTTGGDAPAHLLGNVSEWTWEGTSEASVIGWSWRDGRKDPWSGSTDPNRWSVTTGLRLVREP